MIKPTVQNINRERWYTDTKLLLWAIIGLSVILRVAAAVFIGNEVWGTARHVRSGFIP
jgi:hypothetical protein